MEPASYALMPLENHNNLVALIDKELATKIYDELQKVAASGECSRVSDMYMSRYGIMGYAEYNTVEEAMGGILLVPKKLSLILQLVGDEVWANFKHEHFKNWELEKWIETLDDPRHIGVTFIDGTYYWGCCPSGYGSVWPQMIDQARSVSEEVIECLKKMDTFIDAKRKYQPQDPSSEFSRLQVRGLLPGGT